jgi:hypothetical protein
MKSKATIILIIFLFIAPGLAISQTAKTKKAKEEAEKEFFINSAKYYNMDSIIAPALKIAGRAMTDYSRSSGRRDSYFQLLDNSKNSTLNFRKDFKEKKSFNRSYDMDFDKEQKVLDISISAQAEEGKIQITIIKPGGKNFKVLELEDMESLTWNHSIKAYSDENTEDYSGTWQVKVSVQNAIGYYNVRIGVR